MVAVAHNPGSAPPSGLVTPKTHTPLGQMQELGYRYYSPKLGRWLSRDPLEEKADPVSQKLYVFVDNGPVDFFDPIGLEKEGAKETHEKRCCGQTNIDKVGVIYSNWASKLTAKHRHKSEYCGLICCKDKEIKATPPHVGYNLGWASDKKMPIRPKCAPSQIGRFGAIVSCQNTFGIGWDEVGYYHSHPSESSFSDADKDLADSQGHNMCCYSAYVASPSGKVCRYNPDPKYNPSRPADNRRGGPITPVCAKRKK